MPDLDIAEIPYESGAIRFRYARVLAEDGTRWIRHGLFVAYHENGQISSEGSYVHSHEEGIWRSYHENGQLAAEGLYTHGREEALWRFWSSSGQEESPVMYRSGEEIR